MQTYKVFSNIATARAGIDTVLSGNPARAVLLTTKGTGGLFQMQAANGVTYDYSLPQNSSAIVPISTKRILNAPDNSTVTVLN
tara:strand:- start:4 stop:252 length:249 start_codon:yes stop_codon:yes gene_type:complete